MPVVRNAVPDDRSAVVVTVADAFANDPGWAFILGDDYERLAVQFAGALFDVRVATNTVWVTDDLAAVAMWTPPSNARDAAPYADSVWRRYRALAGPAAADRLAAYNQAIAAVAPAERHWYLGVLATRPVSQGQGLATAVLLPVLENADRDNIACCLETSTLENRAFYNRRGFTHVTEIKLHEGPQTWWLRRSPSSSATAAGSGD